jgi:hypothetical protein
MVKFAPRERKAGDLIRSDEWNQIQRDIHEDLGALEDGLARAREKPSVVVARGIASHDVYVRLGWDAEPQLFIRLIYGFGETGPSEATAQAGWDVRAEEVTPAGFRVKAVRGDGGETGAVEWIALGVR